MGAGQGLIVTAFNFLAHKEVANDDACDSGCEDPKNSKEYNSERAKVIFQSESSEQDNVYNFLYKDKFSDRMMRNSANYMDDGGSGANTIVLNAHGNSDLIAVPGVPNGRMYPKQLHEYLLKYNKLYQESFYSGRKITVRIEACNTGNGFAAKFSRYNSNMTVIAPTSRIVNYYFGNYLEGNGVYKSFINGK
jgi:hypothetical protein